MQLFRVPITWQGGAVVGAGVNILHFDATNQTAPPVAGLFSAYGACANHVPTGVQISVPNSGDIIDDRTGNLVGSWSTTGGGTINCGSTAAGPAGVGACISWTTGGVVTGKSGKPRRLRGRTFIVPLDGVSYEANGTLSSGGLTFMQTLANAIMAAGPLAIWHRPTTKGGSDGSSYGVLSNRVRDKVAFLSSRRD